MKLVSDSSEGCRLIDIRKIMFVVDDHFHILCLITGLARGAVRADCSYSFLYSPPPCLRLLMTAATIPPMRITIAIAMISHQYQSKGSLEAEQGGHGPSMLESYTYQHWSQGQL
jgi:hypothetical protein